MYVVSADQMKMLDRKTIDDIGIPGAVLMENAGRGTVEHIRRRYPHVGTGRIVVLCGRGNNGGDGFVIARYFFNAGARVAVLLFAPGEQVSGDARVNMDAFLNMGGRVQEIADEAGWQEMAAEIAHAGLIVDALLGTGLSSEVKGLYRKVIEDVNAAAAPVVSVDIPSGLDATSGRILGTSVRADLTCTYGLPKIGLLVYPGAARVGTLEVVDIGIPHGLIEASGIHASLLEEIQFAGALPQRDPDSHKGTYGHVCVLAGSPGKTGAAALTAESAMRTGAGLVTLGVPESLNPVLEAKVTEVMTAPLPDAGSGMLTPDCLPEVEGLLSGKSVIALGPGIGTGGEICRFVGQVLERAAVPVVLDADGLNALADDVSALARCKVPVVITPHPGEMARLVAMDTAVVQQDRIGTASGFAEKYGVIVVLKGARTIVAEPGGTVCINPTGNPGMASGGMGDVLTGIIAGLIAQGLDPLPAAQLAVYVHGCIADDVAAQQGQVGMRATDLMAGIPRTLQRIAVCR